LGEKIEKNLIDANEGAKTIDGLIQRIQTLKKKVLKKKKEKKNK